MKARKLESPITITATILTETREAIYVASDALGECWLQKTQCENMKRWNDKMRCEIPAWLGRAKNTA
jgi:hypothetical protein